MFENGSKEPNLRTKLLLERLAPTLKANRLALVGHTAAAGIPAKLGYGPWELSERDPNEGVPSGQIFMMGRRGGYRAAVPWTIPGSPEPPAETALPPAFRP